MTPTGTTRPRLQRTLIALVALVLLVALAPGCEFFRIHGGNSDKEQKGAGAPTTTTTIVNESTEALKVHPTEETAMLFSSIKEARKIIFIGSADDTGTSDRDMVPLSVVDSDERLYWDVVNAVTSAKKTGGAKDKGKDYMIRWYRGYEVVGQATVNSTSGRLTVEFPDKAAEESAKRGDLFVSKSKLRIINKAATENTYEREDAPKITPTTKPKGTLI